MPAPLLVPAIAAGASLVGDLLNNLFGGGQARKQRQANMELAKYSYDRDLEMWHEQNRYNDPRSQMARLKAAGLNPNLVYGTGTVAGNTSSPAPRYQTPDAPYYTPKVNTIAAMQAYTNMQLMQAQTEQIRAQTENLKTRTTETQFDLYKKESLFSYDAQIKELEFQKSGVALRRATEELKSIPKAQLLQDLDAAYKKKQMSYLDKQRESVEADLIFKKFRNEWMELGFTSSDNVAFRVLFRMLKNSGVDVTNLFQ